MGEPREIRNVMLRDCQEDARRHAEQQVAGDGECRSAKEVDVPTPQELALLGFHPSVRELATRELAAARVAAKNGGHDPTCTQPADVRVV